MATTSFTEQPTITNPAARFTPEPYQDESYYGLPAIKSSYYGWLITAYFFVGGLASASQFIATVIDWLGSKEDRPVARSGRYIALAGALASPPLLIADLHTPQRWYNMLRIYRHTSAMSIGSWALSVFGIFSGITAVGQFAEDLFGWKVGGWAARLASIPAALAGGVVAIYTGTLLAATATPLWSAAFPFLSSLFASSAASTAAAALTLAANATQAPSTTRRRLSWFAAISGLAELSFALIIDLSWRRKKVEAPLRKKSLSQAWYVGVFGLGILGPLVVHLIEILTGKERRKTSSLAAISMLVGGFILRSVFVFGGKASARRPVDYLRNTQPARVR